jgi:GNAT superfamily N-acetyltransferase
MKLYFISGASGSGKSAVMPLLKELLGDNFSVYDFDDIGVPIDADKKWRQESTEKWLKRLVHEDKDACLLGQMVLGEILSCPSAKSIGNPNFCLLDVGDFERIQRLKKRNTYGADQNMLNWSSWLRMHHKDPQWMPHVLKENCWKGLSFNVWDKLLEWQNTANIKLLDTSELSLSEVAMNLAHWIQGEPNQLKELIPNTTYELYKNPKDAYKIIDAKLYAYNKQCVPATQNPESIDIHYVIKKNDEVIGGICTNAYTWKIMYIALLFLDEAHRSQSLGGYLLKRVEEDARALGIKLIHLDTFEFQAKDFYLKHGYELFGVLDDCPEGYKRFYLKKTL